MFSNRIRKQNLVSEPRNVQQILFQNNVLTMGSSLLKALVTFFSFECTIQHLSEHSGLCIHHHNQFQNIFIALKRNPTLLSHHSDPPHSTTPNNHQSTASQPLDSIILPVLDISYKQTHRMCDPLRLILELSIMLSRSNHVVACINT